mgnify:CR=1 FL=1
MRRATLEEVEKIPVGWAANEGWNPGLYDSACFFATDPRGFFIGLLEDEPIACISAVTYNSRFGFVGFYIVKPEYRGKGYGLQIWNQAMSYLQGQNVGLDGVIEQINNYQKSGFKLAYHNIRYEGRAYTTTEKFPEIMPLSEVPFDALLSYDTDLFPSPRPEFLKYWISQPESLALAAIIEDKIAGYGIIRKCRKGYKIGPLFAEHGDLARKLLLSFCNFVASGTSIYLDIPEANPQAILLAEDQGMKKVFKTARMYSKEQPQIDLNRIFGITSFELG